MSDTEWFASHDAVKVHLAELGKVAPETLADARLALHYAAQVASSLGFTDVPARRDFRHTTLEWRDRARSLASQVGRRSADDLRIAIAIADAQLVLVDEEEGRLERLDIEGRTLDELYEKMGRAIAHHRKREAPLVLVRPEHELPDHPVAHGAPFESIDLAERSELARWFALADDVVDSVTENLQCSGPGVCWPHHFDLGTQILAGDGRSIGVGFSPGDATYPAPYFYVTPWPYPSPEELGALDAPGCWHSQGWVGAVLTGRELLDVSRVPSDRARALERFIRSAVAASREHLASNRS